MDDCHPSSDKLVFLSRGGSLFEFNSSKSKEFYDYWQNLPRNGLIPCRSSFMPEQVPSLLPNFIIYEMISKDYIKVRLLGSALSDKFGDDRAGENYLDFIEGPRKEIASEALWAVVNKPCGIRVVLKQVLKNGLTVCLESVGLPLLSEDGGNPLILFQKNELDCEKGVPEEGYDPLRYYQLVQRDFIDIGAGLSGLEDLVFQGDASV
ncbi:PAS domain-containing protein [Kiloniella antarctica]|uniref:PAS domain-containing protein n=1 Tax=Kiloniella antarctica TaxID=1550907 RepID=A0ABW5BKE7_9PROT